VLSLTRYQWTVLFAAWLAGASTCSTRSCSTTSRRIASRHCSTSKSAARSQGSDPVLDRPADSLLLLGWAAGGILFGMVADRIGRTRTLMLTMLLYALAPQRAHGPNIWCSHPSASWRRWHRR